MEITKQNLIQAIAALRLCAKQHKNELVPTGNVITSHLCEDVANYLEKKCQENDLPRGFIQTKSGCLINVDKIDAVVENKHNDGTTTTYIWLSGCFEPYNAGYTKEEVITLIKNAQK